MHINIDSHIMRSCTALTLRVVGTVPHVKILFFMFYSDWFKIIVKSCVCDVLIIFMIFMGIMLVILSISMNDVYWHYHHFWTFSFILHTSHKWKVSKIHSSHTHTICIQIGNLGKFLDKLGKFGKVFGFTSLENLKKFLNKLGKFGKVFEQVGKFGKIVEQVGKIWEGFWTSWENLGKVLNKLGKFGKVFE